MRNKVLGVIGGLGPLATAYFMELVTKMTDAKTDQEHLHMIIHSAPSIPDRTKYILGESKENPFYDILQVGDSLVRQGVDCIAIPCMTAHYFFDLLDRYIPVTALNAIRETANHLKEHGITKAGIMATDGTIQTGVFHRELEIAGITPVIPDATHQKAVMSLIYDDVKAGRPVDMAEFEDVGDHLKEHGAEVIILGCTELSMIKRDFRIGPGYIDAMEVLAKQSIEACGKSVKEKYRCLITNKE